MIHSEEDLVMPYNGIVVCKTWPDPSSMKLFQISERQLMRHPIRVRKLVNHSLSIALTACKNEGIRFRPLAD